MATKTINTVLNLRDKFSSKMKQAADKAKENSKQMKLLGNTVDKYKTTAVSGFGAVAKQAVLVTSAIIGIGAAAATLSNGVAFVQDYSNSLSNLQAATGATAAEMAAMKDDVTELYAMNMGDSWSDLAGAMTLAKQVTKQTGDQLKETTGLAVTYRDVFGEDIAASIKASDTLMKNFGITSTEAYNLLSQGAQRGLNKSGELLDTANEYAPYFAKLGFSANDMFDTFAAGLDAGAFNLDKVGDGIKEFGIRSKDGSKASMDAYKAIGLSGSKMTAQFAEGGAVAQKAFLSTVKAINELKDPVKRNEVAVQLFGTQAEDLEDRVISAYGNVKKQFDMTAGTMEGINKIKYNNATQAFQGIGRMMETSVLIPIADKLLPKLSQFGQWFKDNTPQIQAAIDTAFSKGTEVLDGFAAAIDWTRDNADWLIPVITGLTAAIVAQKVINTVVSAYKKWAAVTKGMTIAQLALNMAMNLNPIGLVVTAIGLLVAAGIYLWQNWDTVKEKASALWTWLKEVWTGIKEATVNTFNGMGEMIRSTFDRIVGFVKTPINTVIDMINNMIDSINQVSFDVPDWMPGMGGKTFGIDIPKIPNFALGTSFFQGGAARINERGGEIVNLPSGSQVIPADKSEKMIEGSRTQPVINIYIQGNVIGEEEEVDRIMNRAVPKLMLAIQNM